MTDSVGRQGGREGGRERGRERGREGGREGGRKGGREGGRKGVREGARKRGGRNGQKKTISFQMYSTVLRTYTNTYVMLLLIALQTVYLKYVCCHTLFSTQLKVVTLLCSWE